MKLKIAGHEIEIPKHEVHEALKALRDPTPLTARPEDDGVTDGTGAVIIPVYTVPAGMEFRAHLLRIEGDGITPVAPFNGAGAYWQLRANERVVDDGSFAAAVAAVDAAAVGTTDAPVVAPGAGGALCTSAALAAGFYDVYVSASTGPGAAAADTGNMALQLNGVTILRIPVPANGSDTFGPFRVNVPANGVLRVIAVGAGTVAVPYAASLSAVPRAPATAASSPPSNIAFQLPLTKAYGFMAGPIAINFETVDVRIVAGPANTRLRAFLQGSLLPKPSGSPPEQ